MVFDPSKAIKKMLGPGVNVPKIRSTPSFTDLDGDGIPNNRDCQPRNIFRQDEYNYEPVEIQIWNEEDLIWITKIKENGKILFKSADGKGNLQWEVLNTGEPIRIINPEEETHLKKLARTFEKYKLNDKGAKLIKTKKGWRRISY